jgi:hypothetical protein
VSRTLGLGDDDVERRQLLTGIAGIAAGAALGPPGPSRRTPAPAPADVGVNLTADLEPLLCGLAPASAAPVPLTRLRSAVDAAHADFAATRYERLGARLPGMVSTALATHADAGADSQAAAALLAQTYLVAARLAVKVGDDGLARTLADRAVQATAGTGDLLTLADAHRQVAIVLRRHGHPVTARRVLLAAADAVEPTGRAGVEQWSAWGTLLATAAYTAAVDGDRDTAHTLIGESAAAARRLGRDVTHHGILFGPTNVAVYQIGIAEVLGDAGTAVAHARTIRPQDLPTPERRGRYWVDVARAYHQWGKHPQCYRALLAAEQAAPADVRYRPRVHRMVADILHTDHPRTLPGLGAFAHRIGLPA